MTAESVVRTLSRVGGTIRSMRPKTKTKRPPGRPSSGMPIRIVLRCHEEERDRWEKAAQADGRTLSAWLRYLANRAARASKGG